MKTLLVLFGTTCLLTSLFAQTNPNPNAALDAAIQSEMNTEKFPGVSTVIVKNGEIVWLESYGFADVQNNIPVEDSTVFLLASLSKVFTGTAIMQLAETGQINLDEDINNFLPFNVDVPNYSADSITFRQLMTHSGSIADGPAMDNYYDYPDPTITLADCIERYFSTTGADYNPTTNFLNAAPGTTSSYSNMGTALNGYLVETVTGNFFDQYCNLNIFDELCMNKTAWFMADFDTNHVARPYQYLNGSYVPYAHYGFADYPDGQLRSNVVDLANFMIAYLNGGSLGTNSILQSNSVNAMWTVQNAALDQYQGLNWYQEQLFHSNGTAWLWGHNGGESGVSTDMYFDPANDIAICVLTNGEGDALYICDELYDYALNLNPSSSILPDCGSVGIAEEEIAALSIFPNPAADNITIQTNSESEVRVLDLTGKEVISFTQSFGETTLQIEFLAAGSYVIECRTSEGVSRKKFIKQ